MNIGVMISIWVLGGRIAYILVPKIFKMLEDATAPGKREIVWPGQREGMDCSSYTYNPRRRNK